MRDLLYLKDDQIKDFIEQIFYAYRETYSDPKKILKKYSFGTAHHRAIHLIERYEGLTVSDLLNKLKITMVNQKNFLVLAILLGLAGIVIGSITIFTITDKLSNM